MWYVGVLVAVVVASIIALAGPVFIVVLVVAVAASILAVAGLAYVRRTPRLHRLYAVNDVADPIFGAVGILYGVTLALVVFAVWESHSRAENAVTSEAAQLVTVYRDTQAFPSPQREAIQGALRTYADRVMATEWGSHGALRPHETPDLLNAVWALYRELRPSQTLSEAEVVSAMDRLHDLELQRHMRHLSGETALPGIFWPVLIAGAVIVVLFSYAFHQESLNVQAILTGLLTASLVLVLLLIYALNQPFTGMVPVSKQPLLHALTQFGALELAADVTAPLPSARP